MTRVDYKTGKILVKEDYKTIIDTIQAMPVELKTHFIQLTETVPGGRVEKFVLLNVKNIIAVYDSISKKNF